MFSHTEIFLKTPALNPTSLGFHVATEFRNPSKKKKRENQKYNQVNTGNRFCLEQRVLPSAAGHP